MGTNIGQTNFYIFLYFNTFILCDTASVRDIFTQLSQRLEPKTSILCIRDPPSAKKTVAFSILNATRLVASTCMKPLGQKLTPPIGWLHLGLKKSSLIPLVSSENSKSLYSCNPAGQLWQLLFGLMVLPGYVSPREYIKVRIRKQTLSILF